MKTARRTAFSLLFGILFLSLSSCQTIHYYSQAVVGHIDLLIKRRDINKVIADKNVKDELKDKLEYALAIRAFARDEMLLSAGDSYLTYVELKRPYVMWNVFATPEFSFDPKVWCYPVAGCISYRGYYAHDDAIDYSEALSDDGYDIYVSGALAYSTLGWFDDSILSSMLRQGNIRMAEVIFHELAHRLLYIEGDTIFNESFATTIAKEGVRRWLKKKGDGATFVRYLARRDRKKVFLGLVEKYREKLAKLYVELLPAEEKRGRKKALFAELVTEYEKEKQKWDGGPNYDKWIHSSLNNAKLLRTITYNGYAPAFEKMLASTDGDLSRFYQMCKELSSKLKEERNTVLDRYML